MENATLLVAVGKSARPVDLEPLTGSACNHNLHLVVTILGAMPPIPVYTYGIGEYGAYALPDGWQDEVERANAELEDLRTEFSQYLVDQGVSANVRVISAEAAALPDALARAALTCDLVMLGHDLRGDEHLFNNIVRATLFQAPAGLIINGMKAASSLYPARVFLAWKAGLPAARAAHAALPILCSAADITVAMFDPVTTHLQGAESAGSDLAAWLNHKGCNVTVQPYPSGAEPIGTVMLKRAKETGADLIVMGAYDHSRLREVVFGGTTQTLVAQQEIPVFLCH